MLIYRKKVFYIFTTLFLFSIPFHPQETQTDYGKKYILELNGATSFSYNDNFEREMTNLNFDSQIQFFLFENLHILIGATITLRGINYYNDAFIGQATYTEYSILPIMGLGHSLQLRKSLFLQTNFLFGYSFGIDRLNLKSKYFSIESSQPYNGYNFGFQTVFVKDLGESLFKFGILGIYHHSFSLVYAVFNEQEYSIPAEYRHDFSIYFYFGIGIYFQL